MFIWLLKLLTRTMCCFYENNKHTCYIQRNHGFVWPQVQNRKRQWAHLSPVFYLKVEELGTLLWEAPNLRFAISVLQKQTTLCLKALKLNLLTSKMYLPGCLFPPDIVLRVVVWPSLTGVSHDSLVLLGGKTWQFNLDLCSTLLSISFQTLALPLDHARTIEHSTLIPRELEVNISLCVELST